MEEATGNYSLLGKKQCVQLKCRVLVRRKEKRNFGTGK